MTEFVRNPEENFDLTDFPWAPNYHPWKDMRVHYVDEGPKDAPVMLLLHGMPTWAYLYRHVIPVLLDAGYRCIAPDHLGFGRSDKPVDENFYTIARHTEVLTSLITTLDLSDITLVCQDWGGPIGLAQAVYMPERFSRLTIMNTWLHHPEFEYSQNLLDWNKNWREGGAFDLDKPDIGLLMVATAGYLKLGEALQGMTSGVVPQLGGDALNVYKGFHAPIKDVPDEAFNGIRRFPRSLPFDNYDGGNSAAQTHFYQTLLNWRKPVHFIWGCRDEAFTEAWGRSWAEQMQATFDPIPDANHFLQHTHGAELATILVNRIAEE